MIKALRSASLLAMILPLAIGTARAGETTTYTYDAQGRLVAVQSSGTVNNGQNVSVSYDAAGNRTNYTVAGAGPGTPTLSIGNASVTEGGNLLFTVTLSPSATGTVTVNYASANGTAVSPGDYTATSGTLTFTAGQTSKTITLAIIDDSTAESSEAMTVTLSGVTGGAVIGMATGTGTINDNDTVSPADLAIGDASVSEGGTLSFTVTRSGDTGIAASASYATSSGTATSGSDFTATSGTVSFASSETTKTINVATIDDSAAESAETMTVILSGPSSNTTITTATGTGTINDNDTYITLTDANLNVLPAYSSVYSCWQYVDDSGYTWLYYLEVGCSTSSGTVYFGWYGYPFSGPPSHEETFAQGYARSGALKVLAPYYGTAVP